MPTVYRSTLSRLTVLHFGHVSLLTQPRRRRNLLLPDHLHAIWLLSPCDANFGRRWSAIKRLSSTGLPVAVERSDSKINKREKSIWQRRLWEHPTHDDLDLLRHADHIHHNPGKHGYVNRAAD
ncbi:MAG: REP-associated tyrosine transposase [Burkholderiales bacterium]